MIVDEDILALVIHGRNGDWNLPGGFSHVGEHRNYTAVRETYEETNGAVILNAGDLDYGEDPEKPFKNFIRIRKGRHKGHENITFVLWASFKNTSP